MQERKKKKGGNTVLKRHSRLVVSGSLSLLPPLTTGHPGFSRPEGVLRDSGLIALKLGMSQANWDKFSPELWHPRNVGSNPSSDA